MSSLSFMWDSCTLHLVLTNPENAQQKRDPQCLPETCPHGPTCRWFMSQDFIWRILTEMTGAVSSTRKLGNTLPALFSGSIKPLSKGDYSKWQRAKHPDHMWPKSLLVFKEYGATMHLRGNSCIWVNSHLKWASKPGMVSQAWSPIIWEAEAGWSRVRGQLA